MTDRKDMEIWFVAGSQHLYGSEVLKAVEDHCTEIVKYVNDQDLIIPVRNKAVLTTSEAISTLCQQANTDNNCIGIIVWMHTFSPAKMWIKGLKHLYKPLLHLHTQFNRDIPWDTIDMDFMNLNQSAHGGREFGFISTRLHQRRKVVAGFWKDNAVIDRLKIWARVCAAWADMQELKIARIGDNMRNVAVTEGNQVSAELTFGFSTNGYGLGDVVKYIDEVTPRSIDHLVDLYLSEYSVAEALLPGNSRHASLRDAAQIELGLRDFLEDGSFLALTDTFENLHGLKQLPGIAIQRLMADGYGFGAEGDWKTAALVRCLKVMGTGLPGGESFMEDYTYNLSAGSQYVLGAHMLEICPTISVDKPSCEIHPLGIGGKNDPVRLVFNGAPGPAINVSLIDLGHRFRLLVNTVTAVEIPPMPKLPVARALWKPDPDLSVAATAWILAGGAHHTCFSQSLTLEFIEDFAEIAGIELVCIDSQTEIRSFKQDLRLGDAGYRSSEWRVASGE